MFDLEIYETINILGLFIGIAFGAIAQKNQFCFSGSIKDYILTKSTKRAASVVMAMIVAIVSTTIIANHFEKIESQLSNFELIINFISENVNYAYTFRKYDSSADKFVGQFSWLIFETVIYGLLNKVQILEETSGTLKEKLAEKIKNLVLPFIQGMRVFERMLNYSATLALSELKID